MKKNFTFVTSDKEILRATSFCNETKDPGKIVVLVHGFKGFKDWGYGPYLGEYLIKCGISVLSFNFSHNGIGENLTEFTELEKFSQNTFSREVRELDEILTGIREGVFENLNKDSKIGIIGHSRGGAIALLTASKRSDISALALWASIAKLDRYSERQKEEWRKKGVFEVMNLRTKQIMQLSIDLLNDIEKNSKDTLNIEKAIKSWNSPLLIVHGDQDLAVPISEAEQLYNWSDKSQTEFYKVYGTGHTFDIVHPFAGSCEKFEKVLDKTKQFFNIHL